MRTTFLVIGALLSSAIIACAAEASREAQTLAVNLRWAEAVFGRTLATDAPGDRLTIVHEDVAGDTKLGRNAFGTALRLGTNTYTRGIGVNSRSALRVSLGRPAARLLADIGLDRNVDNTRASVTMHVLAEGKEVFRTPVLHPTGGVQAIVVPLGGATGFDLVVNDGGDGRGWDQADWADARVILQDGSALWLDELAGRAVPGTDPAFSFVYGGQPSSSFLPRWSRQVATESVLADRTRRRLVWTDPETRLEVSAVVTIYTRTPGVDWTLHFTNRGEKDTPLLEQVKAVDMSVTPGLGTDPVLHRLRGSTCELDDWMPLRDPLPRGKRIEFGAVNGRSSADSPFFDLDWGTGGVLTAVGWSGQWRGAVEHLGDGRFRVQAGMEHLRLSLRPGETIRSPRILQLHWAHTDAAAARNLFRRTLLACVVPRMDGQPAVPPIAHMSTSFFEMNQSTESNVLAHLESARGLGFEVFWLDAYWTKGGFPTGMGHYGFPLERVEPRDRFPRGLGPIRDAVRQAGMGYLMWFEPERVHPGTALAKEHPEWVISPTPNANGLFDLGIPAAREFMTRYLSSAIREYGLEWLRIDFNMDPLPCWLFLNRKEPNRAGLAEIRYVEGLYKMWDDLCAAHPRLLIDNCASGGRRIDLETCSRSIPLWRSDNTCDMSPANPATILQAAIKNQLMNAGLNRYLPFSTVGQMGVTPYLFRSGFNGGIAWADDCRAADYPRELLRQAIAEAKRLRKYWFGDFYPLSDVTPNPASWCVYQFHRPAENDGVVLAFRRHESPYAAYDCALCEIEAGASYLVTCSYGYRPEKTLTLTGAQLGRYRADIPAAPGSVVIEYRKIRP
jgi:alpha-galactosidase